MTLHQALVKARKKYPSLRLGQLIYDAIVLSHPHVGPEHATESQTVEHKAKVADIIYSLTDEEMETVLNDMDKNLHKPGRPRG